MSDVETRVVLVKPGDVLVFGNVGELPDEDAVRTAIEGIKEATGVARVVMFSEDIDLAAVPCA